jgi:hypothetical protein
MGPLRIESRNDFDEMSAAMKIPTRRIAMLRMGHPIEKIAA